MEITPEEAVALIQGYRKKPAEYVADVYGSKLWHKQTEIVEDVFKYREVAVKTCNAVGKSYIAARIAHAFLDLIPGSLVVTTAPTWRQVSDVLWREFGTCHNAAKFPLGGTLKQTGFEYDRDWYAVGLSTKYPENFFGYHADWILVIVDEAGGVPEPIFKGVKAITPNVNARVLYIGNPTDPSGTFKEVFDKPTVKKHTISAFDSPNFLQVGINNIDELLKVMTPPLGVNPLDHKPFANVKWEYPTLISPEVVYERYFEWGVDSPMWQALVMGQFPDQAENSLIPMSLALQSVEISKSTNPKEVAEKSGWKIKEGPRGFGHDVARFGNDMSVLTPGEGGWIEKQITWGKLDGVESGQHIIKHIDPYQPNLNINIDDTGNGGGTTDALNYFKRESYNTNLPYQYHVSPYNFSIKPNDEQFADITSELYWNLRMMFLRREIAIPDDPELLQQLTWRQYQILPNKKIKVEDKESYKKRTGRKSPDKSDSLALYCAPRRIGTWTQQQFEQKQTSDFRQGMIIGAPETSAAAPSNIEPITRNIDQRY